MTKPEERDPNRPPSLCLNGCKTLIKIEGHDKIQITDGKFTRYIMHFCADCGVLRMVGRSPKVDSTGTVVEL